MKKKVLFSVLTVVGAMSVVGCGKQSRTDVDKTKAQLTIATFDGGVGDQWLKNAAKIFEEKNKDRTDFESGKTGIQIHIDKVRYAGDYILDTDLAYDIYFTEGVDYYSMTNKIVDKSGTVKLADISDILNASNPDDGGKKIIDKIDANLKSFMNRDGKYYAVPFYDCIYGFVYDKDLFEEKKFYMTDDGSFTNVKSEFGTGPNGQKGDWDDGLPKTYAQFNELLAQMRLKGVTPFVYSNNTQMSFYTARALMSYWSDDEGFEDTQLNYSFNGTAHHIVTSINDGVPAIEEQAITKENGYLLRQQAGIYNALKFADEILCSTPDNYLGSSSVYTAQTAFVTNKYTGGTNKPVGMIVEGTWWENEAKNAFDIAKKYGADSFNYGIMPIPKSSEDKVGEDATFLNLNESYGFINGLCKNMKLAKEFFSFLHTDEQLRAFTIETGMTRGLDYTITDEELNNASTFTKDLMSIKQSQHAKLLYPRSGLDFVVNNADTFSAKSWIWSTVDKGDNPIVKFIADSSLTAEQFFWSHCEALDKNKWETKIVKIK